MNKRQAKKRNKKFGCKKWGEAKRRISFYEQIIKPAIVPIGAYFKEYLEKASKTRHATLKFLPEEFWAIEEEV